MAAPGPNPAPLDDRSRWIDLDGPTHYLDLGGPSDAPVIVAVHGLGGSSVNWAAIAPLLTDRCRVLAPDLAGHGLTQSLGRGTTIAANRALLHRFVRSVVGGPVILMGNSMGGMISLLEASAAPELVSGLILVDPALPMVPVRPDPTVTALFAMYATPLVGRVLLSRRRQWTPEAAVKATLTLCCVDVTRIPSDVMAQHVTMAHRRTKFPHTEKDFLVAARSVVSTAGYFRSPSYRRTMRSIQAPVLMLHGVRDRLVPLAAARAAAHLNPSWKLVELPDVGHVPQLETPRETATEILAWLDSAGEHAARTATGGRRIV
jgi:pimeloyl-ACP methyl ester carboxylesterase